MGPVPPKSATIRCAFTTAFQARFYSAPSESAWPAAKQKYIPTSGTYPKGFLAGTAFAGIKPSRSPTQGDVALVVSEKPCAAAGVFTRNIFKAAPVQVSRGWLDSRKNDGFRGVVVSAGCANAVTGKLGNEHAVTMARETDRCFGKVRTGTEDTPQTLVMSTGVIGQRLPIDKITAAIPKAHQALGAEHADWLKAAWAICTTDTFPKLISRTFTLPSHPKTEYRIAGMAKGAGMIHPNMATLLAIVCTDAKIAPGSMTRILRDANNVSFNSISIDGDTSTNDTVAFFANGAAAPSDAEAIDLLEGPTTPALLELVGFEQNKGTLAARRESEARVRHDARTFRAVFHSFMEDLAKLVVRDGEGATKFVTIRVTSDVSFRTARRAAISIAKSALVKTALYGKDANWGRILCAIGYAPGIMSSFEVPGSSLHRGIFAPFQVNPERTSVSFVPTDGSEELRLLVRGEPEAVDESRAREILEMEDLEILVRLDDGPTPSLYAKAFAIGREQVEAVVWTCDLSHEYVTINGDYRT